MQDGLIGQIIQEVVKLKDNCLPTDSKIPSLEKIQDMLIRAESKYE